MRSKQIVTLISTCFFVFFLSPKGFSAVAEPTLDTTLENGLRLVVYEDRRAPTVVQMTIVKAGSIDEVDGSSGVAHVLEHMMFKRTETMGEGEFSRRINVLGGQENAFTSKELTGYHQQVHKDFLQEIIMLEADRMQNLIFEQSDFEKELNVVLQERFLRTDDNPRGIAYETLFAQAYHASPVRRPIIGWKNDIINLTLEDAKKWYSNWYVPNNLTVLVAGDVDSEAVLGWVNKYYGNFQKRDLPTRKPRLEPLQTGERRVAVTGPTKTPFFVKLWKAPVITEKSGPMVSSNIVARNVVAMGTLSLLLGDNETGHLIKKLVRKDRKAISISVGSSWMSRGPGYFVVDATPASGVSLQELESEINFEIQDIIRTGINEVALKRIKRQARAEEVFMRDSIMSQLREASSLINVGRPLSDADSWMNVLESLTSEDISRVGKLIFNPTKSTVVEFFPSRKES